MKFDNERQEMYIQLLELGFDIQHHADTKLWHVEGLNRIFKCIWWKHWHYKIESSLDSNEQWWLWGKRRNRGWIACTKTNLLSNFYNDMNHLRIKKPLILQTSLLVAKNDTQRSICYIWQRVISSRGMTFAFIKCWKVLGTANHIKHIKKNTVIPRANS